MTDLRIEGLTRAQLFTLELALGDVLNAQVALIETVKRSAFAVSGSNLLLADTLMRYAKDIEAAAVPYLLTEKIERVIEVHRAMAEKG